METLAPNAGRFISAVRRRILLAILLESIAICVAVASIFGLVLVPILWWRGQSAIPMTEFLLGLGVIVGAIRGISRRPSRITAAMEADRQLNLHDVLGTLVLIGSTPTPSVWQTSIAAVADERCRTLRPSAVIVNRLSPRGWAAVVILGGLLLSFALLTSTSTEFPTAQSTLAQIPVNSSSLATNTTNIAQYSSAPQSRPPGPGGTDANSISDLLQSPSDDSNAGSNPQFKSPGNSSAGASLSPGSGTATIHYHPTSADPAQIMNLVAQSPANGTEGSSPGQSDAQANLHGESNSTDAAETPAPNSPAPWTTAAWAADSAAANHAITSTHVPDNDADLVRDYFRRD